MRTKKVFYKGLLYKNGFYKRGFTLLEVLLTVALLVFGVTAVVSVMASGTNADNTVEGQIQALNLAQQKIETLKNTAYASIASDPSEAGGVSGFPGFGRIVTSTESPTGLKTVTVAVTWTYQGAPQTLTLVTLLADKGG